MPTEQVLTDDNISFCVNVLHFPQRCMIKGAWVSASNVAQTTKKKRIEKKKKLFTQPDFDAENLENQAYFEVQPGNLSQVTKMQCDEFDCKLWNSTSLEYSAINLTEATDITNNF